MRRTGPMEPTRLHGPTRRSRLLSRSTPLARGAARLALPGVRQIRRRPAPADLMHPTGGGRLWHGRAPHRLTTRGWARLADGWPWPHDRWAHALRLACGQSRARLRLSDHGVLGPARTPGWRRHQCDDGRSPEHAAASRPPHGGTAPGVDVLAVPSFPGTAGVGAGNQNRAATECRPGDPVTALTSRAAGLATPLTSSLRTDVTGGQAGGVARSIGSAISPVLQLRRRGAARRVTPLPFPSVTLTGPRSRPVNLPRPIVITPAASQPQTRLDHQGAHAARLSLPGSGPLARFAAYAGSPAVRSLRHGGRHRCVEAISPRHRRRPAPSGRLAPGTATQTDPTSSGGGAGRRRLSPRGRLTRAAATPRAGSSAGVCPDGQRAVWGANDPAVSPD